MRCVRHQRSRCWARTVLVWARCISGDLPFCVGREVSGGVWPLLCAGTSPHHFCAGLRLRSGPSLTTRGRHTQRHMGSRVGDRPRLRWAHDLRLLGPYFALGRALATFALGSDSVAGRPLLRGAATLNGSSVPHGHETVSETGHFCALHIIPVRWPLLCAGPRPCHFCAGVGLCSGPALTTRGRHTQRLVCPTWARSRVRDRARLRWAHDLRTLALTLRWAETSPLLRRA